MHACVRAHICGACVRIQVLAYVCVNLCVRVRVHFHACVEEHARAHTYARLYNAPISRLCDPPALSLDARSEGHIRRTHHKLPSDPRNLSRKLSRNSAMSEQLTGLGSFLYCLGIRES